MKNLKKILSLVLALAMALSLMTVAFAKDTGDFADGSDVTYAEAVDVMATVGVFNGVGDGTNFDPKGTLTREQAAKIITYMIMGQAQADKLVATIAPFADVSADRWSAGAIAYCSSEGIMNGTGSGKFNPTGELTGLQFAKMLLVALGYDADIEKMTGAAWGLATSKLAYAVELDDGMDDINLTAPMTREQAAQMAFTTMQTPTVRYPDKGSTISVNGAVVEFGAREAEYVTSTIAKEQTISDTRLSNTKDFTIEFAEKYCPKLERKGDLDAFGRPSYTWTYDKKEIGTYIDTDLFYGEFTGKVTGKDMYDLLGSSIVGKNSDYTFRITIDGVEVDQKTGTTDNNTVLKATGTGKANAYFDETYFNNTNKQTLGQTGKGVLTQVFVNSTTGHVDIAVINTYLAKSSSDYNAKKDEVKLDVYALTSTGSGDNTVYFKYPKACADTTETAKNLAVSGEDFNIADMKKDDIVLVTVANGSIETMAEPEVLSATTLTAFSKDKYVVSDGTQYDYNTTVEYDVDTLDNYTSISATQQLKDIAYDVFLDPYGYVIGVKVVEATKNYIFLTGIDLGTSNLKNKTANAAGILTDGTFVEFTMDMDDSKAYYDHGGSNYLASGKDFTAGSLWNTWCTYTVDKDGVYTLTEVKHEANRGSKDRIGQFHDNEAFAPNETAKADAKGKVINDKNVSLKAAKNTVEGATADKWVYGNDKTIYIVPELKSITADTTITAGTVRMPTDGVNSMNQTVTRTDKVGIIGGVDSISTGVANVDLITWNADEIDAEIDSTNAGYMKAYSGGTYTLYDKNGYIIAAIVVGEDNGTSKTLVYAHKSTMEKEEYDASADVHTWERKVVSNGEEITLTEKGSKLATSGLKAMAVNVWYEVTYKADGTVKSVTPAYYLDSGRNIGTQKGAAALTLTTGVAAGDAHNFVNNIVNLENAINNSNKTNILYEEVWGNGIDAGCVEDGNSKDSTGKGNMLEDKAPSLVESTLYVDTAASKGFYVSDDVKTVLIQSNYGEETTEYYTGKNELKNVLGDLNFKNGTYLFKISAIMTNGRASVVVIHDWNDADPSYNGNRPGNSQLTWINTDAANNFAAPEWNGPNAPTIDDIRAMLESEGCTNISYDASNGWSFTTKGGTRVTGRSIVPVQQFKVTINGKTHHVASGSLNGALNSTTIFGAGYAKATHGTYAKATYADGTNDFVALASTPTISQDVDYEIGYYQIDVDSASITAPTNGGGTITAAVKDPNGFYTKKAAGNASIPVTITTTAAVTGGGLKFTADNGATITGTVPAAAAGGTKDVTLTISTAALADDVTVTLTAADQAQQIRVYVNGTETMVDIGATVHDAISTIPEDAKSFALVQVLGYGDTAGAVTAANATAVLAGDHAFEAADADKNIGNVEYVEVDVTANETVTGFKTPTYTYDKGSDVNQDLFAVAAKRYAPIGATIKLTLTCSATQSASATRTAVTTQFKLTSAAAADKLKYNGTSTVLASTETAHEIASTVSATGAAVDIISENDTVTVTFDAKTATAAKYTPSTITPTAYAETTP